jgi:hypothetical protein
MYCTCRGSEPEKSLQAIDSESVYALEGYRLQDDLGQGRLAHGCRCSRPAEGSAVISYPHEAITFSYYDQRETGRLTYSRNPGNPGILVFSPLMHPKAKLRSISSGTPTSFHRAESKRIPAFIVPSHLKWAYDIAHQINYRIQGKLTTTEKTIEKVYLVILSPSRPTSNESAGCGGPWDTP